MTDPATVFGLEVLPLPEHWTPLEAFVVVKALDADGREALVQRHTHDMTAWNAAGMLTAALEVQRVQLRVGFIDVDQEDDDE